MSHKSFSSFAACISCSLAIPQSPLRTDGVETNCGSWNWIRNSRQLGKNPSKLNITNLQLWSGPVRRCLRIQLAHQVHSSCTASVFMQLMKQILTVIGHQVIADGLPSSVLQNPKLFVDSLWISVTGHRLLIRSLILLEQSTLAFHVWGDIWRI